MEEAKQRHVDSLDQIADREAEIQSRRTRGFPQNDLAQETGSASVSRVAAGRGCCCCCCFGGLPSAAGISALVAASGSSQQSAIRHLIDLDFDRHALAKEGRHFRRNVNAKLGHRIGGILHSASVVPARFAGLGASRRRARLAIRSQRFRCAALLLCPTPKRCRSETKRTTNFVRPDWGRVVVRSSQSESGLRRVVVFIVETPQLTVDLAQRAASWPSAVRFPFASTRQRRLREF